jgi:hypothetical protein
VVDSERVNEQLEVLKTVRRRLDSAGIPYMLTGSIEAGFYGTPRMTRDIDIVVDLQATAAARVNVLFHRDLYVDLRSIEEETTVQSDVLYHPRRVFTQDGFHRS